MSIHSSFRRAGALALVVLFALTAAGAWAAEPLDQVSADAPLVIVIPSLSKLSQKVAMLNEAMGLGVPQMADALGTFKQELGVIKGLKEDGSMVVVLTTADGLMAGAEPPAVLLMPVTDYAAFVGNYGGDAAAAVATLNMPAGRPGFSKKIEGYAVMGPDKDLVTNYKPASNGAALRAAAGKLGEKYITSSDALVYFNMAVLAPKLTPELKAAMDKAGVEIDKAQSPSGAMAKAVAQMYGDAATTVLRDSSAAVIGLEINELGMGLTGTLQFKPNSQLAGIFTGGGVAASQLAKLPDQPYLLATAMSLQGVKVRTLIDAAVTYLPAEHFGNLGDIIKKSLPMLETVKGSAQAYYVPQQPMALGMGGGLNGVTIIEAADAKAYVASYKETLAALNNLKIKLGALNAPAPAGANGQPAPATELTFTSKYNENALQIEGVSVDRFQVDYSIPTEIMQQLGGPQMGPMLAMMGNGNQSGYIAVSGNHVIITTSLNEEIVRQSVTQLKDNKAGLGGQQTIGQVRENLPAKSAMEMYLSIGGVANTANAVIQMMGQPAIQVPADLPPVAVGTGIQDGGLASRLFVPIPVVRFIKDTATRMMMQGGGGARQPGAQPAPF